MHSGRHWGKPSGIDKKDGRMDVLHVANVQLAGPLVST